MTYNSAGGGGGASAVGTSATNVNGGAGGAGTTSSISGASVAYAGGGGGGSNAAQGGTGGTGGAGGGGHGGAGSSSSQTGLTAGTANTGGGGGGDIEIEAGPAAYTNNFYNNSTSPVQGGHINIISGDAITDVTTGTGSGGQIKLRAGRGNDQNGDVRIETSSDGSTWGNVWTFNSDGSVTLPSDGNVRQNYSYTRTTTPNLSASSAVVWTGIVDYISSVKLVIQLEADETGDISGWHSQACEAIIASRGYVSGFSGPGGEPVMTVYGVVYTSTVPLVLFTVQRNSISKLIEVVATKTAACGSNPYMRIYSVEMATRD